MNYSIIKQIPSHEEIRAFIPLNNFTRNSIESHKKDVMNILSGIDKRLVLIVGPCSAWPYNAVINYANMLNQLSKTVDDKIKIIMRVYIQKPRTVTGWAGPINQPDPFGSPDIVAGIYYCRKLMVEIAELGLGIADECLFTHNSSVFQELLSWVAIGARSSEDQEHRVFASSLNCPVGMKNPTHGVLQIALNSVIAAQSSHRAVFDGYEVETHGNEYAHLVLRGINQMPNYSAENLEYIASQITDKIKNPAVIIDVSHDNCIKNGVKDHKLQPNIILDILNENKCLNIVKGFMMESFIKDGKQTVTDKHSIDYNGLSITDPCLCWNSTETAILDIYKKLKQ